MGSPILPIHMDENIYGDPNPFDGFRFYKLREQKGENAKQLCVSTNIDFLTFGHGAHAWYHPSWGGFDCRFFAVHEVKMLLAFVLLRYDLGTIDGARPKDLEFEARISPDVGCKLLIRQRLLVIKE
jgi:ent-kaurene oxidase